MRGGIRVPLVIRWPGKIKPETKLDRVSNIDFYPTLKSILLPEESLEGLDGTSLKPLFENDNLVSRDLFWHFPIYLEAYKKGGDEARDPLFRTRPGSVIISGDWKLHHYYEDDGYELYNLVKDPGEKTNVKDLETEKFNELKAKQELWIEETKAPNNFVPNPLYDEEFSNDLLRDLN